MSTVNSSIDLGSEPGLTEVMVAHCLQLIEVVLVVVVACVAFAFSFKSLKTKYIGWFDYWALNTYFLPLQQFNTQQC